MNLLKKNFLNNLKIYFIIFVSLLPSFYIWFQAPEIRFGWGLFISLSCYILSILIFNLNFLQFYIKNIFPYMVFIIFGLLIFDNKNNLNFNNFFTPYSKQINYSQISKVKIVNGYEIYKSNNWQCYDFHKICVNTVKDNYDISKKFNYLIIKSPYIK